MKLLFIAFVLIAWKSSDGVNAWSPSEDAYDIIKRFEGISLNAYRCV